VHSPLFRVAEFANVAQFANAEAKETARQEWIPFN
jgi:hypothetical protein